MLAIYCLFLFALVLEYSLDFPVVLVHAQDDNQQGFVSIDCGLPKGSDYRVSTTGIYYKSDADLIDSGESKSLLSTMTGNSPETYLKTVRSFPQGKKNCYTIKPSPGRGTKYLIRATFRYGNYDNLSEFPTFDLNLGADTWSNIVITGNVITVREEIIHVLSSDNVHVCLIKTGSTTPFISALELRPLDSTNSVYTSDSGSLRSLSHTDCVTPKPRVPFTRYKDDIYDRIWWTDKWTNTGASTQSDINNLNNYRVPVNVLRTACTPDNVSEALVFSWNTASASDQFYVYLHFAEVEKLQPNQSREFNLYLNEKLYHKEPIVPPYLGVYTILSSSPVTGVTRYTISLNKTERSTRPPVINAYEIYTVQKISDSGTNETDVSAMLNIKSTYNVTRDWQGDPCEPDDFLWDGLECSKPSSNHSARITSLNLSTSQLTGEIVPSIANLTQLKTLDLSNNNLSGQVPEFLSLLPLIVLNLKGNKFTGPVPAQLLENQKKGILSLSYDGSGDEKKINNYIPAVVGTVLGFVFLAAILFGIWKIRGRVMRVFKKSGGKQLQANKSDIETKNRQFTYSQVVDITRNFRNMLGEGAFGKVYHGYLDDIQVAVKMLSTPTTKREFKNEVSLLMRVHHKNLTSMVGYCDEEPYMGIIYEYMAERNLEEYLSGNSKGISSWVERLQIAQDVAQGLEYLHDGCKPAIIHRDVKTGNILLTEQFEAKLADFGMSKAYPAQGGTHMITVVSGTPGYIDPEYENTKRLTEKSDVFSFGVVLLVMITGRPPILRSEDRSSTHISRWVDLNVQNGDVTEVVDPRFRGKYDVNSVWRTVDLALLCTSWISSKRPTMNIVVTNLKECLAIEFDSHNAVPCESNEMLSIEPGR